jgi:hypothetical protein
VLKGVTGQKDHVSILTIPQSISVKTFFGNTPVKREKHGLNDLSVRKSEIGSVARVGLLLLRV